MIPILTIRRSERHLTMEELIALGIAGTCHQGDLYPDAYRICSYLHTFYDHCYNLPNAGDVRNYLETPHVEVGQFVRVSIYAREHTVTAPRTSRKSVTAS